MPTTPSHWKEFPTKLAGVTHPNADGSDRQELIRRYARPGEPLLLVPEPNNPYSPNAIAVYLVRSEGIFNKREVRYQLGYLREEVAMELTRYMAREGVPKDTRGVLISAEITDVNGGTRDKPARGVNIFITVDLKT